MFRRLRETGCQHLDDFSVPCNDLMRLVQVTDLIRSHRRSILTDHSTHVKAPVIGRATATLVALPLKVPVMFGYRHSVACQHFDCYGHTALRWGVVRGFGRDRRITSNCTSALSCFTLLRRVQTFQQHANECQPLKSLSGRQLW